MHEPYIAAEFARLIVSYYEKSNFPEVIPRPAAISGLTTDPYQRLPLSVLNPYIEEFLKADLGYSIEWHIANHFSRHSQEMLGYALQTSQNITKASSITRRFLELITNVVTISHQYCKDGSIIVIANLKDKPFRNSLFLFQVIIAFGAIQLLQYFQRSPAKFSRDIQGKSFPETLKMFAQARIFTEYSYTPGSLTVIYARSISYFENPEADPRLHQILSRELEAKLSRMPGDDSWSEKVSAYLAAYIQNNPSLDDACSYFHQSRRTLSRHLKHEETSFKQLVNEMRKQKADELIATNLPLKRVAGLSGFGSLSNFSSSFKDWYGKTPAAYRSTIQEKS